MAKLGQKLEINLQEAGYDDYMERLFEKDTPREIIEESTGYSYGELTNLTTQAASFIINETGTLILDLTSGGESAQYFDLRSKNANYGLVLRESDGTGSTVLANFYVVDSAPNYISINVDSVTGTDALNIDAADNVGIGGIASLGKLEVVGNLAIGGSNNELRFYEGANYIGFKAPTLSGDQIWSLPSADGNDNDFLQTNASGVLSWVSAITPSTLLENAVALLNSTDSVDLNGSAATETSLYTVPTGKTCFVTHIAIRNMSADAASSVVTFGKIGGPCDEWRGNQTLSGLDGTTKYTVLYLDQGTNDTPESAAQFDAEEQVGIEITTAAGSASTCSIDVFGTLV